MLIWTLENILFYYIELYEVVGVEYEKQNVSKQKSLKSRPRKLSHFPTNNMLRVSMFPKWKKNGNAWNIHLELYVFIWKIDISFCMLHTFSYKVWKNLHFLLNLIQQVFGTFENKTPLFLDDGTFFVFKYSRLFLSRVDIHNGWFWK